LWRLEDVWSLNGRYHLQQNFPGLLAIGNQAFMLYALDLNDPDATPSFSLGLSSSVGGRAEGGRVVRRVADYIVPK